MKKAIMILLAAFVLVAGASAQVYSGVGIGYVSDSFNEEIGGIKGGIKVDAIAVSFQTFQGETLGLALAGSLGLPIGGSVTIGSQSVKIPMDLYSTKMHANVVGGLGYRMTFNAIDLIVGAGLGYGATLLMPKDYTQASVAYMTLGPGALVSAAYNVNPQMALYASFHGMYGLFQLVETSSYFTSALVLSPAAGIRFKIR